MVPFHFKNRSPEVPCSEVRTLKISSRTCVRRSGPSTHIQSGLGRVGKTKGRVKRKVNRTRIH